jgi:hypothetical protein
LFDSAKHRVYLSRGPISRHWFIVRFILKLNYRRCRDVNSGGAKVAL